MLLPDLGLEGFFGLKVCSGFRIQDLRFRVQFQVAT